MAKGRDVSADDKAKIAKMNTQGVHRELIAARFGISKDAVTRILRRVKDDELTKHGS